MNRLNFSLFFVSAVNAFKEHVEEVNRLNVFPVPDGDTGMNMYLTLESAMKSLMATPRDAAYIEKIDSVSKGALLGARGNSGVILSQILQGFCDGLKNVNQFDVSVLVIAFQKAKEKAFKVVQKPVAGTILTVLADSAEAAFQAAKKSLNIYDTLDYVVNAAFNSVKRTPDLLPVLKENGVVDAGGLGFALFFKDFVELITGKKTTVEINEQDLFSPVAVKIEQINDWAGSKYQYCTEFLFVPKKEGEFSEEKTLKFLNDIGDCVILVGDINLYKIHLHTNVPGTVISAMTDVGEVIDVHINNMVRQSADRVKKLQKEGENKEIEFVAVSSGAGTTSILNSLGISFVIEGGQTMNPSVLDFLKVIDGISAETIVIFPNNKNIILTANTVKKELKNRHIIVIPTTSVMQAIAFMARYDGTKSIQENMDEIKPDLANMKVGEITKAIRESKTVSGEKINENDYIGIVNNLLGYVHKDLVGVMKIILHNNQEMSLLTILGGNGMDENRLAEIVDQLRAEFPDIEIDSHIGGQLVYDVMFSLE